jgi:predicted flap endonuclease-1-like 5' DNA nuclease
MGLLDTLLSLIGLGGSSTEAEDDRREATVSVERETHSDAEGGDLEDAPAAGSDATASTETLVDESADEPAETPSAAEPAEAAGPGAEAPETELDTAASESQGETTGEHEAADAESAASVKDIKGIGPAYAERLSNEGIDSVADLAAADPAALAAAIDLSETRVSRWVERARDY